MNKRIFSLGVLSDKGLVKESNQDGILIEIGEGRNGEFGLFAVADGMGGHAAGDVASEMAISGLRNWWCSMLPDIAAGDVELYSGGLISLSLEKAINNINAEIIGYGARIGERVGTTLSVLFIFEDLYWIEHVGDSRIYIVNKAVRQVTEDHSLVAGLVAGGFISRGEAAVHPKRNILTRCLGAKHRLELFESRGSLQKGDVFILCSDGFYVRLEEDEILSAVDKYQSGRHRLQNIVDVLSGTVKARGEADNISAIFIAEAADKNSSFIDRLLSSIK